MCRVDLRLKCPNASLREVFKVCRATAHKFHVAALFMFKAFRLSLRFGIEVYNVLRFRDFLSFAHNIFTHWCNGLFILRNIEMVVNLTLMA